MAVYSLQSMPEGAKKNDDPDYELPYVCKPKKPEKVLCDFCKKPADGKEGKRFLLICKDCNAKGKLTVRSKAGLHFITQTWISSPELSYVCHTYAMPICAPMWAENS